ncbi:MAG TPA: NAD(P)H-hydrate dehydratase [Candidatus Saccharimonadales bacterium]|nr:NAD(P)H-hydrate dehydratase [Candidatus Saccharimonadales bacterium]
MRLPQGQRLATAGEMLAIDHAAISRGTPSLTLMERAGRESARVIVGWWRGITAPPKSAPVRRRPATGARPPRGKVIVLAGPGNNGGDGFVCAKHLKAAGFTVRVLVAAKEGSLSEDSAANHQVCERERTPVTFLPDPRAWGPASEAAFASHDAIFLVDALLGTGSKGAPRGAVAAAIEMAERSERPIASIDIPSGLDPSTGYREQPSIKADLTITLALPKRGLALEPGRSSAGQVEVVDIGIPQSIVDEMIPGMVVADADWARMLLPTRPMDAHKGSVGRVLVVGGSAGMVGALALATEAALRSGAGYVSAALPLSCVDALESRVAEVVKRGLPETRERALSREAREEILAEAIRADVVAIGPGLSRHPGAQELARELVERVEAPIVLDADGLNAFEGTGVRRMHGPLVLTPHFAEAARMSGHSLTEIARDPAGWARRFSDESRAIVCLKSTPMVTAVPAEPLILNATGNPGMATAGAGDVLTGTIAGLIAQGVDAEEAAGLGCFLHGLAGNVAARRLGMRGLIAGDIVRALPAAIMALESGALAEI